MKFYALLTILTYNFAGSAKLHDATLDPFFKVVDTTSKNNGSKHGNINLANKCIADALGDMEKWITKGN